MNNSIPLGITEMENPIKFNQSLVKKEKKVTKQKNWTPLDSESLWVASGKSQDFLPSGYYKPIYIEGNRLAFQKRDLNSDDLIEFEDPLFDQILCEIKHFFESYTTFKKHGFLHTRGYLLWGPPGSGKTALSILIIKNFIKTGGIVFSGQDAYALTHAVNEFRAIQPETPIICLFEDIDAIVRNTSEEVVLNFLDGELQTDRILNLATTNYPEVLDKRITNRPRRFDRIIKIGMPNETIRSQYIKHKLPDIHEEDLQSYVKMTEKFSFAAITDFIISIKCFNKTPEEAVQALKFVLFNKKNSNNYEKEFTEDGKSLGF